MNHVEKLLFQYWRLKRNQKDLFAIYYRFKYSKDIVTLYRHTSLRYVTIYNKNKAITSCKMATKAIKGKAIASSFNALAT